MATTQTTSPAPGSRPTRARRARARLLAAALLIGLGAAPARAATFQLDTTLAGADFDAILDGFPGLAPFDGLGDLAGNALAVALKDGVTEERAMIELPLAALAAAGVESGQIVSAILTFNVDDVLTTFGPGTDFDGTAGERIHVATYSGDGNVDLDDYVRGTLVATITTGPNGSITDASVRTGGPIVFSADLTASVKSLVAAGATHVGIRFSTDDSPTGTSLDDRGDGGSGAPGSGGAIMPYLVITTADATPTPAPTATAAPTAVPTVTTTAGPTPSPSPAPTGSPGATPSPGATASPVPTQTAGPGPTPGPDPTAQPTPAATRSPGQATPTPAQTGGPTATPGATSTPSGSITPAPTGTSGATPTPGATTTPSSSATPGLTATPRPTTTPAATFDPTLTPTPRPILTASPRPTATQGTGPTPAPTGSANVPTTTDIPDGSGDQLVLLYDARDGFTTFLNLHNLGDEPRTVRLELRGLALDDAFTQVVALAAGATRTIDVGALRSDGLPARAGAAFVVAIDDAASPVVTRALGGSFTIANLTTGSAWGAPAAARRAVASGATSTLPAPGTPIDGDDVRLRGIRPARVGLSVYYDPSTLEPAALGGNQLVFLSFDDDGATPVAAVTTWSVDGRRSDGSGFASDDVAVSGVLLSHLEEIVGSAASGAAGSITFDTAGGATSRLVFFSESLGTFATGYLLPPVAE